MRFTQTERRIFFQLQTGVMLRQECDRISVAQATIIGRRMGEEIVASKGQPSVYYITLDDDGAEVTVRREEWYEAIPTRHIVWENWPLVDETHGAETADSAVDTGANEND